MPVERDINIIDLPGVITKVKLNLYPSLRRADFTGRYAKTALISCAIRSDLEPGARLLTLVD